VDLPPEEADEIHAVLHDAGIRLITLLAPTTPHHRAARLATAAEGYLYYVSMTGVTGTRAVEAAAIEGSVLALKEFSPVPVAVGFGISTPSDVKAVGRFADAVVVGSALVRVVEASGTSEQLIPRVTTFVRSLKDALHEISC
ncbi:MAG TPA: tryptophan synthase subunit alpha, partial [Desulfuromonadales bacterium]|nr:tryptophan synthase subunit alpha [Desulfuromonadales bacterium]